MSSDEPLTADPVRLIRPIDRARDHVRGGGDPNAVSVVGYFDFLCPYCRRLRKVMDQVRRAYGGRVMYAFRHFPNERAHPGAERIARAAEAAANQGRFWEMHDWIFEQHLPIAEQALFDFARSLGLEMDRFKADVDGEETRRRVADDLADGRRNGVTGTPAVFIDGIRYDGAWDFYALAEAIDRPVAARVRRSARAFASLPASGGLVLLLAAAAALLCANTVLRGPYHAFIDYSFSIGPSGVLTVAEWCSEGLLSIFFLLVGLEIRREVTAGALADRRAIALPVVAAIGGVLVPAAIYLAFNPGPSAKGWAIPTATDVAFTLGILAVLGQRIPAGLRVLVAALAVVDDILSVLTLAIFYSHSISISWVLVSGLATAFLLLLNRWRVYAVWPYVIATVVLWLALNGAGIHAALAGIILAIFLPTQPSAAVGPLLAQAATALAALEQAEKDINEAKGEAVRLQEEPIWDWASRNLSAASERLLSPADRIESAVAPWSSYFVLPLFAFSATGIPLAIDLSQPLAGRILAGVILGLVLGKPIGILSSSLLATKSKIAAVPEGVGARNLIGAACLCGVSDTVALLVTDQALSGPNAAIAKIGVLAGSAIAALLGTIVITSGARSAPTLTEPERSSSRGPLPEPTAGESRLRFARSADPLPS
jgi:NhaA family Na+:H+ antiporter